MQRDTFREGRQWDGQRVIRFKLTDTLESGGSANAKRMKWDSSEWVETEEKIVVYDPDERWYGDEGDESVTGRKADEGRAIWMPENRRWEVLSLSPIAEWIEFTLDEDLEAADETVEVTISGYWEGRNPNPNAATFEINTPLAFEGSSGNKGYARRRENGYDMIQLDCD